MRTIKQYLQFVKPYKWKIVWTVVVGIVQFRIPLLIPLILKYVIDVIVGADNLSTAEKTSHLFWLMGGSLIIFLLFRPPVEYARQYLAQWVANTILYDVRDKLFDHIQKLSLQFYSRTKTGEIISRVIHDVEQTKTFDVTGLMNVWLDLTTILIAVSIMLSMDVWLTIVFIILFFFYGFFFYLAVCIFISIDCCLIIFSIILFPLYVFSVKYFYGRLRRLTRERSQALAEVQGHLHERVQGIPVTRSFALEDYEQEQFDNRN